MSCPTCALTTYTAAKFATRDECPRCSARLGREPLEQGFLGRRRRVVPVADRSPALRPA